ncbi:MAG: hypothetical protein ACRYFX_23425 [Janthinobacterium lividum]
MENLARNFFEAYLAVYPATAVFADDVPPEMVQAKEDEEGWFTWKLISGTLPESAYRIIEAESNVQLPQSFIDWHRAYFFLDADCSLLRLPVSNPNLPLADIRQNLEWSEGLIANKLYSFAYEGNDTGPLVFDGRVPATANEFPIRVFDHEYGDDLSRLSPIIFSSFEKLLECLTHFMRELKTRKSFEIIPDFLVLDPAGAGSTGAAYWLQWPAMLK